MNALKLFAEIGWALVVISPFVWKYVFNKMDRLTERGDEMNFTKEQIAELENLTKAIAEWLKKNADAHTSVTIETDRYDVTQDVIGSPLQR